jgi:hypothetical protein
MWDKKLSTGYEQVSTGYEQVMNRLSTGLSTGFSDSHLKFPRIRAMESKKSR